MFLSQEFDEFLAKRDVRSTVDYPTSFYWKRLIEMYPEAKVILTTRRPETWRKSVLESIYYVLNASKQFPVSWTKNWTGIGPRIQASALLLESEKKSLSTNPAGGSRYYCCS